MRNRSRLLVNKYSTQAAQPAPKKKPAPEPGKELIARLRADHESDRDFSEGEFVNVVEFSKGGRAAVLMVSKIGGYLFALDSKIKWEFASLRVDEALAWCRCHTAQNWFDERRDHDEGWSLLLGICEGVIGQHLDAKGGAK